MNKLFSLLAGLFAIMFLTGYDDKPKQPPGAVCGTIRGLTCPEGQYCDFGIGQCKVADAEGACKTKPTICTKEFNQSAAATARPMATRVAQPQRAFPSIIGVNAGNRNLRPAAESLEPSVRITLLALTIRVILAIPLAAAGIAREFAKPNRTPLGARRDQTASMLA